ncbi:MAG: 1-(5-phosphoribosyl)-5-((5-phosphoribosylamino)methylideneamino)imidazole-4-carboxamide isomerase, partial [Erysipelotrichaceae bacterium]|nr:1-(5-phosphoribosyl)-5-((5-phosphoribosylamino)methylideneamino)imidazole-4-carboxamide isomerase [Erysipelotrichaceae bacterium]
MGGLPVRLYQGAYESAAQVADDVLKTALSFEKAGA